MKWKSPCKSCVGLILMFQALTAVHAYDGKQFNSLLGAGEVKSAMALVGENPSRAIDSWRLARGYVALNDCGKALTLLDQAKAQAQGEVTFLTRPSDFDALKKFCQENVDVDPMTEQPVRPVIAVAAVQALPLPKIEPPNITPLNIEPLKVERSKVQPPKVGPTKGDLFVGIDHRRITADQIDLFRFSAQILLLVVVVAFLVMVVYRLSRHCFVRRDYPTFQTAPTPTFGPLTTMNIASRIALKEFNKL